MKVEERRCWEVPLLTCHAKKVINCISKPEPHYLQDGLDFAGLVFWSAFFLFSISVYFLVLQEVKMKTLCH